MEYNKELIQLVLIKRLRKASYQLKEEKKHCQDAKNIMEAVRQWQATPKYQRLLKRQQDQLEALHQQQLKTNRQVEIQCLTTPGGNPLVISCFFLKKFCAKRL
jgi:hypothetical protein